VATIYRPCYTTREEVRRALDIKQAAYNDSQLDRNILAATDSVEGLCQRVFYPEQDTRSFDWPNYQYAYPWRLWLDADELADITINPPIVTSGGVVLAESTLFWGDPNYPVAPFTYLELNRDSDSAFGNGPTPQREIVIQGTYGYWANQYPAGTLAASMLSTDSTMTVTDGFTPGVGDVVAADSEWMIVSDSNYIDTTVSYSGLSTVSAADNIVTVANGSLFFKDEVLQVDAEWLLVQMIQGNTLIVKRAWGGSILSAHTSGTIWARRLLTVLRGQLGTSSASHSNGDALNVFYAPAMVKQLAVAEAIVGLSQEPGAYSGSISGGQTGTANTLRSGTTNFGTSVREQMAGVGLPDLRDRVLSQYGRKTRSRVI
jgi:hypothetical protein